MNLRTLLTLLRTPHLRSVIQLRRDLQSFLRIHFLFAAFESGLLDALPAPASKVELQSRLGIQRPELFESLLEMGVALGELSYQHNGYYYLKGPCAQALAARDGDPLVAFIQEYVSYHGSVYRHLAGRLKGEPLGDYLQDTGDLIARSSRVMEPLVANFVRQVVSANGPMHILEIGCGSGIYLRYAAEANPQLTGRAIDMQQQVAEQTRKNLATWGFGERFQILAGDIRRPPADITGPFDLITLYNNIYYFTLEERIALFKTLLGWSNADGRLALVSVMRGNSIESANFDLVLQSTQGCAPLPALEELVKQLRASGFGRIRSEQLAPGELLYGVLASP